MIVDSRLGSALMMLKIWRRGYMLRGIGRDSEDAEGKLRESFMIAGGKLRFLPIYTSFS
jgi:hypothetical protein